MVFFFFLRFVFARALLVAYRSVHDHWSIYTRVYFTFCRFAHLERYSVMLKCPSRRTLVPMLLVRCSRCDGLGAMLLMHGYVSRLLLEW